MSVDPKTVFTIVEKNPSVSYDEDVDAFVFVPAATQQIGDIKGESFEDPLLGFLPPAPERVKIDDIPGESFEDPLLGFNPEAIWGTNGTAIIDDLG